MQRELAESSKNGNQSQGHDPPFWTIGGANAPLQLCHLFHAPKVSTAPTLKIFFFFIRADTSLKAETNCSSTSNEVNKREMINLPQRSKDNQVIFRSPDG